MKQGWEIKKLGEIATYINGYAFKPEHWGEDGLPIIRIQNLNNPNAEFNYCSLDVPDKYVIDNGDILISWSASLGVYEWNQGKAYLNQHIFKVLFNKIDINKFFFKYAIGAKIKDMIKNAHGATMKHIVKGDFDNTPIPVPPLPVQEQIVSELDLLSGIIEKKREQLKEFDALAQSIFYDMFGDPITNEKGWEVKKLGEVADIVGGSTPKTNIKEYWNGDNYWVTPAELHGTRYISSTERCITDLAVDKAHLTQLPIGTVLLSSRAPIGKVCITRVPMYCNQGFKNIICSNKLNSEYVYQYLIDKTEFLKSLGTGATFKEISKTTTENITIPIPPLPLQRQFASKIEAIEKQKELIKQSISETETLFNARMQHYFN